MTMLAPSYHSAEDESLVIGVVNNMPPNAMQATRAEFTALLDAASAGHTLQIRFFALPSFRRRASDRISLCPHHEDLEALWEADLDGLIVSGTEPVAAELTDEPYWPAMAKLIDWACDHTTSTIWSCLAAQAAVLRLDGIARRKLPAKLSGVFECTRRGTHRLTAGSPANWQMPHSRCHDLDAASLQAHGYEILSCLPDGGVDMFAKEFGDSLFLCLQGHPEYSADCLLREYRRDIRRYLLGQRDIYPAIPEGYFDEAVVRRLLELREQVLQKSSLDFLGSFDAATQACVMPGIVVPSWQKPAVRLYANWLSVLAERKTDRVVPGRSAVAERLAAS